jgi:hypothetical protein
LQWRYRLPFLWNSSASGVTIPICDNYRALLGFLNEMMELKSIAAKVSYFIVAQHNEYKPLFGHGLVWLQFLVWDILV